MTIMGCENSLANEMTLWSRGNYSSSFHYSALKLKKLTDIGSQVRNAQIICSQNRDLW
jgi:hypothetical protein